MDVTSKPITKLLHLTDLHLMADKTASLFGVNTWESWQAVWQHIQAHHRLENFDLLVLSGDLSQDDSRASYEYIAETINDFPAPVLYFPGNHDDYPLMQQVMTNADFSSNRLHELDHVVVIGLNSQQPGKVAGWLADTELDWLAEVLQTHRNKPMIIFLHHHVLKVGSFWLDRIRLKNANDLLKQLDEYDNVKAVISGHVHQSSRQIRGSTAFMTTPSTCMQFMPNKLTFKIDTTSPGYAVITIGDDVQRDTMHI